MFLIFSNCFFFSKNKKTNENMDNPFDYDFHI